MLIIGVDYHPSFQQIAFLDQETGECGERRLNHSDGEADRFYDNTFQTKPISWAVLNYVLSGRGFLRIDARGRVWPFKLRGIGFVLVLQRPTETTRLIGTSRK
jgi:hypothetical protein